MIIQVMLIKMEVGMAIFNPFIIFFASHFIYNYLNAAILYFLSNISSLFFLSYLILGYWELYHLLIIYSFFRYTNFCHIKLLFPNFVFKIIVHIIIFYLLDILTVHFCACVALYFLKRLCFFVFDDIRFLQLSCFLCVLFFSFSIFFPIISFFIYHYYCCLLVDIYLFNCRVRSNSFF